MNPFNLVQQFSKQTGIKDPHIDTMLQQQEQNPVPGIRGHPLDNVTTSSNDTHPDTLTIDVLQKAFDALKQSWFTSCFNKGFSQQKPEDIIDAEWRPVPKYALPPHHET